MLVGGFVLLWFSFRRVTPDTAPSTKDIFTDDVAALNILWKDRLIAAYTTSNLLETALSNYAHANGQAGHLTQWLFWQLQNERHTQAHDLAQNGLQYRRPDLLAKGCCLLYLVLLEFDLWARYLFGPDLHRYETIIYHQYSSFSQALQAISRTLDELKERDTLHKYVIQLLEVKARVKGPTDYP